MKVVQIHNFYQQSGGEDRVYAAECELLRRHGHTVRQYSAGNDQLNRMRGPEMALRTIWNSRVYRDLKALFKDEQPDVVHVHNTFPLLSPAIYYAAAGNRVPVVQTLHNYRLLCPVSTFYRDGHVCEDCLHLSIPYRGVLHSCYRNSRAATATVAAMLAAHRAAGTYRTKVGMYIALTEFARSKFIEAGFPADRIRVKPNFLTSDPGPGDGTGEFALFIGRLTEEKGVRTLLAAWQSVPSIKLKIAGTGPLASYVSERAKEARNVEYLGQRERNEVLALLQSASFLVFPSEWYEGLPLTIVEAFACGTPVICSRLGSMQELVHEGRTGAFFQPGNAAELASTVRELANSRTRLSSMRVGAREQYLRCYTPDINYRQLIEIYEGTIALPMQESSRAWAGRFS